MTAVTTKTTVQKRAAASWARIVIRAAATVATVVTTAAFAAEQPFAAPKAAEPAAAVGAGSLLQVTFSLVLVLGAVFAAAWLVRRLKGMGRFGAASLIQIVADAPLGPKERAVLLQVGEQQFLVGVSSQQVNLLHVLPQPVSSPPTPTERGNLGFGASPGGQRPDFASILRRSVGLK